MALGATARTIAAGETRSCMPPLDAGVQWLRDESGWILPWYVLAMTPFTIGMWLTIDAVSAQHRSGLVIACLLLTAAMPWRWMGQAAIQRRMLARLRGEPALPLRKRLLSYLLVRLVCNFAFTWGAIVVAPVFWGFLMAGFAAPVLLQEDRKPTVAVAQALGWISRAAGYLCKAGLVVSLVLLLALLVWAVTQMVLFYQLLPSLLGIDITDLQVTASGPAWLLACGYALFLIFDLYWTVAAVLLWDHLQQRRTGTDLRLRLAALKGGG